jgi:hypothetical protein
MLALGLLVATAILLDMAVAANLVLSQRAIFTLGAAARSRLASGAAGSALGGLLYSHYGWHAALLAGMPFPLLDALYWCAEPGAKAARYQSCG